MQKNNSTKLYFFYFLLIYFFLFFTNSHFSFEDSLRFGGADGFSYMAISEDAPLITSKKIMSIHSERFFFPYVIGLFSKFFGIDYFLTYKIFVFTILIIINLYTIRIFKYLNLNLQTILVFLTLINFNPYITRFYLAIPTIINDLIFVAGILIIIEKIITKNKNKFFIFIGFVFTFASRQTSIGLILAYIVSIFIKGKKLLPTKNEISGILIFIIFIILNIYYSSSTIASNDSRYELYSPEMRILGFFIQDIPIKDKLIFLLLPFLSFTPLLFYFIFTRQLKLPLKKIFNSKLLVFIMSYIVLVISQPILSGAEVTGRNIIRLTSLAYIPLMIFLILITKEKKKFIVSKKFFIGTIIAMATIHSFHPTFSLIKVFDILRF